MGFQPPVAVSIKPLDDRPRRRAEAASRKQKEVRDARAKFKLEIMFGKRRSSTALNPVMVTIWESGKRFHGGGDEKMYWCGYDDCMNPIKVEQFMVDDVLCTKCNRRNFCDPKIKAAHIRSRRLRVKDTTQLDRTEVLVGERMINTDLRKLSVFMARHWRLLGGNADVSLKFHRTDIRYDPVHQEKQSRDLLDKARSDRLPGIYVLERIIKDTVAGKSVEDCFFTFLTA
jgi:hypothetical protein